MKSGQKSVRKKFCMPSLASSCARNIANLVNNVDTSAMSVIQYAVGILQAPLCPLVCLPGSQLGSQSLWLSFSANTMNQLCYNPVLYITPLYVHIETYVYMYAYIYMCVLLIYIYTWYMRSVWPSTHFWFRSPQPGSTHRALRTLRLWRDQCSGAEWRPSVAPGELVAQHSGRVPTPQTAMEGWENGAKWEKCRPNMVDLFSEFFNHFQFWYNLIAQIVNFELSKFCVFCTFARHDSGEVILLMFPSRPGTVCTEKSSAPFRCQNVYERSLSVIQRNIILQYIHLSKSFKI